MSDTFVVAGTPAQQQIISAALARCRFDFTRLRRSIPVTFADLSRYQALGLFWTSGRIEIDRKVSGEQAQAVFLAEAWHAIDQYVLTNNDRATLQAVADTRPDGHTWFDNQSYYADLGESMMDVFLSACTDLPGTGLRWDHAVTGQLVAALRTVLGATTAPSPPSAPPVSGSVYTFGPVSSDGAQLPKQTQTVLFGGAVVGVVELALYRRRGLLAARARLR